MYSEAYSELDVQLGCFALCRFGRNTDVVKYLLQETHCDPNSLNKSGQTPLAHTFSWSATIRHELVRHGAYAANVYKEYGKELPKCYPKQPTKSAVKIFIVGSQGMGKTTLAKSLKKDSRKFYFAKRMCKVSAVDKATAGVIPHHISSKTFGHVTIYDFAGHEEFYSSHDMLLHNTVTSSSAIFLLVVDLRFSDKEFKDSIYSWLAFIDNHNVSEDSKPQIIIVGSHADMVSLNENIQNKEGVVTTIAHSPAFKSFHFAGFVCTDCRYAQSSSMTNLRQKMSESCTILQHKIEISFNCHCLYIYLLDRFLEFPAIRASKYDSGRIKASTVQ